MYRIFIDEFGHDNLNTSDDPREQYLALTGVVLDLETAHIALTERMNAMKLRAFGDVKVVLHRREIINQRPHPFTALASKQVRDEFNDSLLGLIRDVDYRTISVLIDKKEHKERYKVWRFQPYHYC